MSKNPIIVFEGVETSGKTTHINFISRYLKKHKYNVMKIREPGGSKNSEKIRKLLLDNKSNFSTKTDLLLYLAARNENMHNIIKKNHKKKILLIDRFIDSTVAYQHFGMGINKEIINKLNNFVLGKIKPNLTILNLVSKKNLVRRLRIRRNKNRYDKFNFKFYNKVQNGFLKISKNKRNYFVINSDNDILLNRKEILKIILKKIK